MAEKFLIIILFIISAGSFAASCSYFKEKGFLLNNAYLFASKRSGKKWTKIPLPAVSSHLSADWNYILLNTVQMIFNIGWLFYAVLAVTIAAVIYAVISTVKIEKRKSRSGAFLHGFERPCRIQMVSISLERRHRYGSA